MTDEQIVAAITTVLKFLQPHTNIRASAVRSTYQKNLKIASQPIDLNNPKTLEDYDELRDKASEEKRS